MTHPLRSTGITLLRHYYGMVRPCVAHRTFGLSELPLGPFPFSSPTRFSVPYEGPDEIHAA